FTVFTGSHRFVLDFLTEEVLARQPEAIQSFLLYTSILERLNGSLCEALTGQPGGQAMLQALERANLFVVPLDETRQWYRYHHLFAEMLQNRLLHAEPDLVSELHRRASNWYEQHAQSNPAIQHALAANDIERAADLIEQHSVIISQEQSLTLLNWLNALPDRLIRSRPRLCTMHAMLLIVTMQHSAAEARLYDAEVALLAGIAPDEVNVIRGQIALTRLSIFRYEGDLVQSVTLAQQALILLPETEVVWRQAAIFHSANAFLVSGDVTGANDHIANLVASAPVSGDLMLYPGCTCMLASLWMMRGRLRKAIEIYRTITQVVSCQAPFESPIGLFYYFNLADLLRELNKLEEAELSLMHGMRLLKDGSVVYADALTLGHTTLARLQMAQGKNSEALATLDAYTQAASRRKIAAYLLARATTVRIQIKLAQGDLASAIQWVDESGLSINDAPNYVREREYLTLARVKIAQGLADRGGPFLKDALSLLKRHLTDAEEKARTGSTIEILMLQALVLSAQSSKHEALSTLQCALTLAEPEGYIRLFVDEGQPMLNLLREAWACGIQPDYVTRLLSLMDGQHTPNIATADPDHSGLIEPLTEREREVLYLISTGASNGEIARRLIVSVNTVKRHVFNLCGKLSVQSRTQAIVRAQRLHLL
ncbi:MAG TPA: LuxR C-terminal-related transcriptional regulator, partial [Ktedonobacteraceae bacterium]|nr:LuxR C-terminal-related transcriptional regulator [Ktedonobacteraceae bacterium]